MRNTTSNASQAKLGRTINQMSTTELAVRLFIATQTEDKPKRDQVSNKRQANQTHYEVGTKVRATIEELGGTMPEDLPTPEKGIPQLARMQKKLEVDNE